MKEAIGFPFAAPALTTALEPRRHYAMAGGGGSATLLLMTDTILHPFSFLLQEVDFALGLLPEMRKMPILEVFDLQHKSLIPYKEYMG